MPPVLPNRGTGIEAIVVFKQNGNRREIGWIIWIDANLRHIKHTEVALEIWVVRGHKMAAVERGLWSSCAMARNGFRLE